MYIRQPKEREAEPAAGAIHSMMTNAATRVFLSLSAGAHCGFSGIRQRLTRGASYSTRLLGTPPGRERAIHRAKNNFHTGDLYPVLALFLKTLMQVK